MVAVRLILALLLSVTFARAADDADMQTLRGRWIDAMLAQDARDADQSKQLATRYAQSLLQDGSWSDVDYANRDRTNWGAQKHLQRMMLMARVYRASGDHAVLEKLKLAIDFWLTKDLQNPNWWHNQIGTPQALGTAALLIREELSPEQITAIGKVLRRSTWEKWTGQNLVWGVTTQIKRGLLESDADAVAQAINRMYEEVRVSTAEGIQPDYSFHQHGPQIYNGAYGLDFAEDVPRFVALTWGTRWQIPEPRLRIVERYLLDGQQWMMHRDRIDYSVIGRVITRKDHRALPIRRDSQPPGTIGAAGAMLRSIELLAGQPVSRGEELRHFAARIRGGDVPALVGNRHFPRSDYHVHHRPGWFASVKMFSQRTVNAELVNGEGLKSQHLSDGANLLYLDGNEYFEIFPAWDWTKVPGTTAEQNTLDIEKPRSIGVRGKTSFVGGVSDGMFGLAAMHLARGKLTSRKVWAFFDDSYICLGAEITSDSDNPVATSVNQCVLRGKVSEGPTWVHHDGVGYVFPDRANVKLTTSLQHGRWSDIGAGSNEPVTREIFNLWIDHGVKPRDVSYSYTVFPRKSPQETAQLAANPQTITLSNTSDVQAVYNARLNLLATAFWKARKLVATDGPAIEVDQPCLILVRRDGKRTILTASNPENLPLKLNVRVDDRSVELDLPGGDLAGSSVTRTIE